MSTEKDTFWKRLADINAGMLGTSDRLHFVPMSHYADPEGASLWFITADGTDLAAQAASGPVEAMHLVGDASGKLWTRIEGTLELSTDREKLDEIWNAVASSWFEQGERDPDIRLLKFSVQSAEVWTTTGSIGFLYEVAKANLTGAKPDMGDHFTLNF